MARTGAVCNRVKRIEDGFKQGHSVHVGITQVGMRWMDAKDLIWEDFLKHASPGIAMIRHGSRQIPGLEYWLGLRGGMRGSGKLGKEEGKHIGIYFDALAFGSADAVAAGVIDAQQDGAAAG